MKPPKNTQTHSPTTLECGAALSEKTAKMMVDIDNAIRKALPGYKGGHMAITDDSMTEDEIKMEIFAAYLKDGWPPEEAHLKTEEFYRKSARFFR